MRKVKRSAKWLYRRGKRLLKQLVGRDLWYPVQVKVRKVLLGSEYGGYYVCPDEVTEASVVYSLGIGKDVSFDLAAIERFGVHVYAFDPTPESIVWTQSQELPDRLHFFDYGVADHDGVAKFTPPENPDYVSHTMLDRAGATRGPIELPVRTLRTIMAELGHEKIDVLKMDIEGAEYAVIEDLAARGIDVRQLVLEFHHGADNVPLSKTKHAIETLNRMGLRIFHIAPTGLEYSFIRR